MFSWMKYHPNGMRVVSPMMFTAVFSGINLCMKNDAILLLLPVIKEGCFHSRLKHSTATCSGLRTAGERRLVIAGRELM